MTNGARWSTVFAFALAVSASACGPRARAPQPPEVFLRLTVSPNDATIRVDDRVLGSARTLAGRFIGLSRGPHRLAVNAPGYDRVEDEIDLPPGKHERVVTLAETPER